jgi:hypothetical protein
LVNGCSYDSGDALAILGFVLLAHFHPSPFIIYATVIAEQLVTVLLCRLYDVFDLCG